MQKNPIWHPDLILFGGVRWDKVILDLILIFSNVGPFIDSIYIVLGIISHLELKCVGGCI